MPAPWETDTTIEAAPWEEASSTAEAAPWEEAPQVPRMPAAPPARNLAEALAVPAPDLSTPEQQAIQARSQSIVEQLPALASPTQAGRLAQTEEPPAEASVSELLGVPKNIPMPSQMPVGGLERVAQEVSMPELTHALGPDAVATLTREAFNLAKSIPDFFTSLPGLAAVATGNVLPVTTSAFFTADMLKTLAGQIHDTYKNWGEMSFEDKLKAFVNMAGTGVMIYGLGKSTLQGTRAHSYKRLGELFAEEAKRTAALETPLVQPPLAQRDLSPQRQIDAAMREPPSAPAPVPVPIERPPDAPARRAAEPVPPPSEPVPEPVPVEAAVPPAPPAAPVDAKPEVPLRPDPPVPESEFPPIAKPGDKLVTIERPDGTRYRAAVSAASWPKEFLPPGITDGRTVHRVAITGKEGTPKWSSGMLDPGEKIIEDTPKPAAAPAPAETTEPLLAGQQGGGAAELGEVPSGAAGEQYGVAKRVRDTRAEAGTGPVVEPGQGISAPDSVERGRELMGRGANAENALADFERTKKLSSDDMAVVRAQGEELAAEARRVEEASGTDSEDYRRSAKALFDWDRRSKAMQTEWHKTGMAQQGETEIDTGTFTGLQRAHQENTGTDFTPGQKKRATQIADINKDLQAATGKSRQTFNDHIRRRATTDAEKAALDAAQKAVREWAITRAKADNKARVANEVHQQAVEQVQADAARRAQDAATKTVRDDAVRRADAENKDRVKAAQRSKELANIDLKRVAKSHDAEVQRARQAAADLAAKERKLQGDPTLRVWTKAKEYLDTGLDNFDDIRKKLATDLGMSIEQVTRLLQQDKRAKYLADDLWRKQLKERNLKAQSKRWVQGLSTPALTKALQSIPRGMFVLKVGLHGTVALGTHAPTVAFQPRFWNAYVRNFGKMYKMVGSRAYYESQVQNLLRSDNYITARRAGLVNDPFVYEEYAMNPVAGNVAKISARTANAINAMTGMGNRGYSVLKMLRQDMFDQHWNLLPKSMQIPEMAQAIAYLVNHATGVVQGRAPPGTNLALFAPRLEASRVMWLVGDPVKATRTLLNWKNASQGDRYFAMNQLKEKAWVIGTFGSLLALNQGILSASNSDQKVNVSDPFKPDFLKFKAAGMNVSYGNPMITMARLPLRLFVGIENEGKFNKIVYEDENVATVLFEYVRSQMSPFAGTTTDLAIGRDFMRRPLPAAAFGFLPGKTNIPKRLKQQGIQPYTWTEYAAQQAAMIPLQEALKEVWGQDLMMDAAARKNSLKALATIIVMGGTGGRLSEDYSLKQSPAIARAPWE